MKKVKTLFLAITLIFSYNLTAQVAINTDGSSANPSAMLDVKSDTAGVLIPNIALTGTTDAATITTPAVSLLVYNTASVSDVTPGYYYNSGTTGVPVWARFVTNTRSTAQVATPVLTICCQSWMTTNLDVDRYRNGDPIPYVTDPAAWAVLTTGAYCYYNNDSTTYAAVYGKLYNWYAVNDPRGLAPEGWHVPTHFEWITLTDCLGGQSSAGGEMKERDFTHWNSPNTDATNYSGFTGLPGGYRSYDGLFGNIGSHGTWWSSSELSSSTVWSRTLGYDYGYVSANSVYPSKLNGFSVRCLRD